MKDIPDNSCILNDNRYTVKFTLINTNTSIDLPLGLVKQFVLYDNLYSIFQTGKLIVDNSGSSLENFSSTEMNELREQINSVSYAFNSDNNDYLEVKIIPITPKGEDAVTFPPEIFNMHFVFSVYAEEEYTANKANDKTKVFYLRDGRAEKLLRSNIEWSTSLAVQRQIGHKINVSQVSNKLRSIHTGYALKHLIATALQNSYPVSFANDWDIGRYEIFHTSPTQHNVIDDIEAILDKHISFNNLDNCVLRWNNKRSEWSLKSFTQMFDEVLNKEEKTFGSRVSDAFHLHGSSTLSKGGANLATKPLHEFSGNTILSQQLDGLTSYQFLNSANDDGVNSIISSIVHNYNYQDKQFDVECSDGYIDNVEQTFQEFYAGKMAGQDPTAIFPTNDDKKRNLMRKHVYTDAIMQEERLRAGRNNVISRALALSPGMSFSSKGGTHRDAGDFVIISGEDANSGKRFAQVMYGEWLMTNVVHVFMFDREDYSNTITCIKPHTYSKV